MPATRSSSSALRRTIIAAAMATAACVPAWTAARAQEVVLIPNRVIYPGETISVGTLKEVTLVPGKVKPAAVATTLPELDGKVARRTLLPGRYIPVSAVRSAWMLEQGATVQVSFVAGGLTISIAAVTLQPGSPGDVVKVRNIDSGKVLTGTVMEDGSVRVDA